MGDGTEQNPYTHEDVLKLIEEHSGSEGLNLSGKVFEKGIDLSGLKPPSLSLSGIILNDALLLHANFDGSNLDDAVMQRANLRCATFNPLNSETATLAKVDLRGAYLKNAEFREADLSGAQFQEDPTESLRANLEETDFRNANLFGTNFKECYFYRTKLEGACIEGSNLEVARLGDAVWGNYKIGEENKKKFDIAEHRYRHLKMWYTQSGYLDIAAKFYYREREANRKSLKWYSRHRWTLEFLWALFGYGEGWKRILFWIAGFVLFFALIYLAIGTLFPNLGTLTPNTFLHSLYYSAVSFVALGYGSWVKEATGWVKGLGVFETFLGFFMMTLLLVTFVRKWTR